MMTRRVPVCVAILGLLIAARAAWLPISAASATDGPKQSFAESIGIKIVPILQGEFVRGSTDEQGTLLLKLCPASKKEFFMGVLAEEQPSHRVRITKLQGMSAYEITVGQFRRFVEDQGYRTEAERDGKGGLGFVAGMGQLGQDPRYGWRNPGFAQTDDHPVVNVTWNDAMAFCQWLSRKDGQSYRLPTEAEWEYCCRAGSSSLYSNGNDPERLVLVGNVSDARLNKEFPDPTAISADDGFAFTAPVGRFSANKWGLYDMHGNVGEWCLDNYDPAYYKKSPATDPSGASSSQDRTIRGGSWFDEAWLCRSASREGYPPKKRDEFAGFRVARVLPYASE